MHPFNFFLSVTHFRVRIKDFSRKKEHTHDEKGTHFTTWTRPLSHKRVR